MSKTKRSTLRLSEVARHVCIPDGIVTTGWPHVVAQCAEMGVEFDGWQHGIGRVVLGKRADGKYAATVGGVTLSIPRQVGKTFLVGMIIIALCVLFPGLTVLWTAHRTRTATKTFGSMQGYVKRKKVWPHIAAIRSTNGEQEIKFVNGSVIMFGAREQGFGRGFDEVDVEVFDEGQILTEKALEDMVAATNQSRHPHGALLFFMGTPPRPGDPGDEFANRRAKALDGRMPNGFYVEFSADEDADLDDRKQWAKANPSFPLHTPVESMERMRENLTDDDSFRREALGIWDSVGAKGVIPAESWKLAGQVDSMPVERFALAVEAGPDLVCASITLAGEREDGRWHTSLEEQHAGAEWVPAMLAGYVKANPQVRAVVVDLGSPTAALCEKRRGDVWFLKGTDVRVTAPKVTELGSACSTFLAGIVTGDVVHTDQPQVNVAATVAGKRDLADTGMWVWSRKTATSDITPIQAATLALWGAQNTTVVRPARRLTNSAGRRVVTG